MYKFLITIVALFFAPILFAQELDVDLREVNDDFPTESLANWDATFQDKNVGFLHVYTDPVLDPEEVYLLRGQKMGGYETALLPKKVQRLADRMNATLYAAAAIRDGRGSTHYLVRMEGASADRIELFRINGAEVEHVQTLAYRECQRNKCRQMDSFITDVDGDTNFEIMQLFRVLKDGETHRSDKVLYTFEESSGKWKKSDMFNAPWASTEFFDPAKDDQ